MKCRFGFDAAHEELSQMGPLLTYRERAFRFALKETLFQCHYGNTPCGWSNKPSKHPIYDGLALEFFMDNRYVAAKTEHHPHPRNTPLKEHLFKYHAEECDPGSIFYGYAITDRLHDQMHEHRRQRMTTLRYEEGLPGVFVK